MMLAKRGLSLRAVCAAVLLVGACQYDSGATFTDPDGATGAAGDDSGGSGTAGGSSGASQVGTTGGKAGVGGGTAAAGGGKGGASSGGKGGTSSGGKGGTSSGGKGGTGAASVGGKGGGNAAGTGGKEPATETLETTDIDDTYVSECAPEDNFGLEETLTVDADAEDCSVEALLDVPRLQLPAGVKITAATLSLSCTNTGDEIVVSYVDSAWSELDVTWHGRPTRGDKLTSITCSSLGAVTVDLTSAFQAWLADQRERFGIYLQGEGTDGSDFATSEAADGEQRPLLKIVYTAPQ